MSERLRYNLYGGHISEPLRHDDGRAVSIFLLCEKNADRTIADGLISAGCTDFGVTGSGGGDWAAALGRDGVNITEYASPEELCEELHLCLSMPMRIPRDFLLLYDDEALYRRVCGLLDNWAAVR